MYVGEGSKILVPKLSRTIHTTLKQVTGRGFRVRKGLEKRLQSMLRPITVIQKKDHFGLGYKPNQQERWKLIEEKRGKRIANFLEKVVKDAKMEILPLSYSFCSVGFMNLASAQDGEKSMIQEVDENEAFGSLTIDMIGAEKPETRNTRLLPFPRGQVLNNWTVVELPVVFKFPNE